tara:strand:- start:3 stop:482 length:480 start_codon:yes stop_codon:yes gene_type:complete
MLNQIDIPIRLNQIRAAKLEQEKFDLQKTYDKFKCDTNYIGLLGEMVFNEFLKTKAYDFKWFEFTKQGWDDPDFIINNKTVDLKTTFSDSMWIQQEKFDVYIYAQINKAEDVLSIKGWLTKDNIRKAKEKHQCNIVRRDGRVDYVFKQHHMRDINLIFR